MLQRKDMNLWMRTTQMSYPGERLELAFSELYPDNVPQGWKRPEHVLKSSVQTAPKKAAAKPAVARTASDASEGELTVPAAFTTKGMPASQIMLQKACLLYLN